MDLPAVLAVVEVALSAGLHTRLGRLGTYCLSDQRNLADLAEVDQVVVEVVANQEA